MLRPKMMVGSGCLLIILITGGFMLMLRSCLSKYDERSAQLPAIIYSNDTTTVIFSLVGFDKTTSYSSGGGFTRKTVTRTYFIQTNDINTAKKLKAKEVREHDDIEEWPVRIIGSSKLGAWVFLGELMAFNPITLNKIADIETLETTNPSLKGRFPKESKYYEFDENNQLVHFTSNDGMKWKLDANTLQITAEGTRVSDDNYQRALDSIDALRNRNRASQDSMFRYNRQLSLDLRDKKITMMDYYSIQKKQMQKRAELDNEMMALNSGFSSVTSIKTNEAHQRSAINSLARVNPGYSQMGVAIDTFNKSWVAVYDAAEFKSLSTHLYIRRATDETARHFLVTGNIAYDKNDQPQLDKTTASSFESNTYLDGSLLRDKQTARPFRLPGDRYLIIHKDRIGSEGKILLSAVEKTGKLLWTSETGLKTWFDWQTFNNRIIVFGLCNNHIS